MTASKATAERQGLLLTRSAKAQGILTFDFAGGETRALRGSQRQIQPQKTLGGIMVSRELLHSSVTRWRGNPGVPGRDPDRGRLSIILFAILDNRVLTYILGYFTVNGHLHLIVCLNLTISMWVSRCWSYFFLFQFICKLSTSDVTCLVMSWNHDQDSPTFRLKIFLV